MKNLRAFGSLDEAVAARGRLESESKSTAELIGPGDGDARERLEQAGLSEQDVVSGLKHLESGRALLIIDAGMLDMMRMNDLLGPNDPTDSHGAWAPGVGHLEDEVGGQRNTPERSEL